MNGILNNRYGLGAAAICAFLFLALAAAESTAANQQFRRDCEELTMGDHRLAGTKEALPPPSTLRNG